MIRVTDFAHGGEWKHQHRIACGREMAEFRAPSQDKASKVEPLRVYQASYVAQKSSKLELSTVPTLDPSKAGALAVICVNMTANINEANARLRLSSIGTLHNALITPERCDD